MIGIMNKPYRWTGRALSAALLAAALGGCDFVEPTRSDPNVIANPSLNQLFTGVQVNTFYLSQSIYARVASMWTQQTAGVTSQFTALDQYRITEDDSDDEMAAHYYSGGLIDIRAAIAMAEEDGRRTYAGILKVYEAYLIGLAASIYGDIPYSQAADPEITSPALDPQLEVYAAVQTLLDEAIGDLRSGADPIGTAVPDFNFAGATACWIDVAHSLKARFYMHVAEVQGTTAYQQALSNAQQGISDAACNWRSIHTQTSTENNIWHQFTRDRPAHIVSGAHLVSILNGGTPANFADDDPRLAIFFKPATASTVRGQFVGSRPGSPEGDIDEGASPLNTDVGAAVGPAYNQPILTCAETQFIVAEAQYRLGNQTAAREAANRGIACEEAQYGVTLARVPAALAGNALFERIMQEKYIALFLNIEVWNDYKRTCLPRFPTFGGQAIPGRLLYGTTERQTNPNIPSVGQQRQTPRNPNDPNPCS